MKPFVIPFFLSHQGCPHRCIYCDQHSTGGHRPEPVTAESVVRGVQAGLASPRLKPGARVEVGFFGGTFTMMPLSRQEELLDAAGRFVEEGQVVGLRLSTRPDALSLDQVSFLKGKGVKMVEIGAQSLDDAVLLASRRGHTAGRVVEAAGRVRDAGLGLVLQLLPGLPGEDEGSREKTLQKTLDLAPDQVRVYPLLVIRGTRLAELYHRDAYQPLSLDQAVDICARFCLKFRRAGIRVIRLGLQPGPELEQSFVAGPHHPAFGHLVRSALFARALNRAIEQMPYDSAAGPPVVLAAPADISAALGHRRQNREYLAARYHLPDLAVKADPRLEQGDFIWQNRVSSIYQEDGCWDCGRNEL